MADIEETGPVTPADVARGFDGLIERLAAERERSRKLAEALDAIRTYSAGEHHDPSCGHGPCIECLIHETARATLAETSESEGARDA